MVEMLQTLGHVNKIELNKENNTISNILVNLKQSKWPMQYSQNLNQNNNF